MQHMSILGLKVTPLFEVNLGSESDPSSTDPPKTGLSPYYICTFLAFGPN